MCAHMSSTRGPGFILSPGLSASSNFSTEEKFPLVDVERSLSGPFEREPAHYHPPAKLRKVRCHTAEVAEQDITGNK